MKQDFTAAVGASLLYKSLPNGTPIRGVVIDNPTGGWLYLVSENQWIPPYTNGWSMPLTYEQTSVNVEYRNVGPAGQISTQQGTTDSPWRLELNSEVVDADAGGPTSNFVEQFTPVLRAQSNAVFRTNTGLINTTLIAAVPNKRIRLLTLEAMPFNNLAGAVAFVGSTYITYLDINGAAVADFFLSPYNPNPNRIWPVGVDLPTGSQLEYAGNLVAIHRTQILSIATYQLI